jgi:integrase
MPKKYSQAKGHRIQVSYKGVGRIRARVRGVDASGIQRIRTALDEFFAANNLTALRAVKSGVLSPNQALELFRTSGANATVRAGMFEPLRQSLFDWLETHDVAPATRKSYRDHLIQLQKEINQAHSVADLPAVLRAFRVRYLKRGSFRVFNVTRSICCAFADSKFGSHSPFYIEVFAVKPIARPKARPKRKTVGVEVADIVLITSLMETHHAEHVWSMCLTGMRKKEFFATGKQAWQWADNIRAISIEGTKTVNAKRICFRMDEVKKPTRGPLAIERAIRKACTNPLAAGLPPIHLHAFRYTCKHWCEQAGIIPSHIENYLGWSEKSMMSRYGKIDVIPYLEEDRRLLTDYIEREKQKLRSADGSPSLIRELRDQNRPEPIFYFTHTSP